VSLLIDLFGYLSIILHGLTIVAQSMALGGVLFIAFLARPFAPKLGTAGAALLRDAARMTAWAAIGMVVCEAGTVALETAALVGTIDLPVSDILGAGFAVAGMVKTAAAALIALILFARGGRAPLAPLLALVVIALAAATATTHAVARMDGRATLLVVEGLHQLGAAIWIGGIPCFLLALTRMQDGPGWRAVGARFSRISMVGVACILVSGVTMSLLYIGSWQGFYGTAYGVMVGAKIAMFLMLLALGGMNFLLVERLRDNPGTPINRLKRFAEVEIGIGVSIFFAAASLTSVPPAVDLTQDRVTWQEIVARNTPHWPRIQSPDHDSLALPELQAQLDAEAAQHTAPPQVAFVPGSGDLPPRNAADIAWSEYNHHWSGMSWPSASSLCSTRPDCAGRATGRCCSWGWRSSCSCARTPKPGRSAISASSRASATWRCCSTACS
jgi:putative copper resistance protein D